MKGAAAGFAGGIVGGITMELFNLGWYALRAEMSSESIQAPLPGGKGVEFPREHGIPRIVPIVNQQREQTGVVSFVSSLKRWFTGESVEEEKGEEAINALIQLGVAGMLGAAYGIYVEHMGDEGKKHGLLVGGVAASMLDQATGPALGLESGGTGKEPEESARKLAARIVYTLASEATRERLRERMD
jgi:hypothetical protein